MKLCKEHQKIRDEMKNAQLCIKGYTVIIS